MKEFSETFYESIQAIMPALLGQVTPNRRLAWVVVSERYRHDRGASKDFAHQLHLVAPLCDILLVDDPVCPEQPRTLDVA